ncbi:DinB family protein [Halopseudomonas pelagia]|uniref:DinB family protein n=1 Tax=Halopseudomonas pelagia TaxID=553151 RepID=UPI0003A02425|nr:DinB family protein [Halopseudomonas pelagia]|tara:strand:+ start:1731 stop:2273 length:543 start_codon:yes stop_codon:yes gene_type:complete
MSLKQHFEMLAAYNQLMNSTVYIAASHLSPAEFAKDRGAFFASIQGTLNHILVGDTIWLKRFATHPSCQNSLRHVVALPSPTSLDQILFQEFNSLWKHRAWLDQQIIDWVDALPEAKLDDVLSYQNSKALPFSRQFSSLILHFFNHQTHHRGQVSTLLSQAGEDIGVTDLLALIPDQPSI